MPTTLSRQALSADALTAALQQDAHAGWQLEGEPATGPTSLTQTYTFASFEQAMAFMQGVAVQCSALNHHPDWRNVFNRVTVRLSSWESQHRVTEFDLALARLMNEAAASISGSR